MLTAKIIIAVIFFVISAGGVTLPWLPQNNRSPHPVLMVLVVIMSLLGFVYLAKDILTDLKAEPIKDEVDLIYWQNVEKNGDYCLYLQEFPNGQFVELAQQKVIGRCDTEIDKPILPTADEPTLPDESTLPIADEQKIEDYHAKRYSVQGSIVTDTSTGLMWMRCALGQNWNGSTCAGKAKSYTWKGAINTVKIIDYEGYDDWRVPTKEELLTLVYCSSGDPDFWVKSGNGCKAEYDRPTILTDIFPNTLPNFYWSSSPFANNSDNAW
ncbi:MAG: DUF1566 domain-containing protein, partial [Methylococcales bacterium]|nr:DUF1566 domain-containing protein [Methylococcales bacterium]